MIEERGKALAARLPLFAGIVSAGLAAQAIGLETQNVVVAFAVVAVGVFFGVGLGKALSRG